MLVENQAELFSYSIILSLIDYPESYFASTIYSMDLARNFCSQLFALDVAYVVPANFPVRHFTCSSLEEI